MGIFSEADHHPFINAEGDAVVEEAHGGLGEPWRDEQGIHEYVRPVDRQRGLFIRDESRD
ncbi:MAG TPA: hypothetical protein VMW62_12210 [Chloroflexota bacterium]|nr:hypothetical protein [Chloroflexota bacterium]